MSGGWVAKKGDETSFADELVKFIWSTYGRQVKVAIGGYGEPYDTNFDVDIEVGGTDDPTTNREARACYDAALHSIANHVAFLTGIPAEVRGTEAHSGALEALLTRVTESDDDDEPLTTDKVM